MTTDRQPDRKKPRKRSPKMELFTLSPAPINGGELVCDGIDELLENVRVLAERIGPYGWRDITIGRIAMTEKEYNKLPEDK